MDPYIYTEKPKYQPHDIEDASDFYDVIERSSLTHQLSENRPYVYWTMEIYDKSNGIKGGGGLGVLAADTRRVAEKLEVPFKRIPRRKLKHFQEDARFNTICYNFRTELWTIVRR